MSKCLLTYLTTQSENYSPEGLQSLHKRLDELKLFPYSQKDQQIEVQRYAGKLSIQGVQAKLSAKLLVKDQSFKLVETRGDYILKPQSIHFNELPENEDLTMKLAKVAGLDTPWHGFIKARDNSLLYAIKRFDRYGKGKKLHQEDFAQLVGATRVTKYQADMEKVSEVIEKYCSFPTLELPKLLRLTLFSFLIGNEDMHLKNFSLQTDRKGIIKLTPAYDLLNSSIAMVEPQEEMALSLNGKKHGFTKEDFIDYYALEYLMMTKPMAQKVLDNILSKKEQMIELINKSFLSKEMKESYLELFLSRIKRLE